MDKEYEEYCRFRTPFERMWPKRHKYFDAEGTRYIRIAISELIAEWKKFRQGRPMRQIVIKQGNSSSVILGTNGEDVVIKALQLFCNSLDASKSEVQEAYALLEHLGVPSVQPRSFEDWEKGGLDPPN